jgi:hypothetical protein
VVLGGDRRLDKEEFMTNGKRGILVMFVAVACLLAARSPCAAGANACAKNTTGKLKRITDDAFPAPSCNPLSETAVALGAEGPVGPQGPIGPSDAYAHERPLGDVGLPLALSGTGWTTVGSLSLPAGSYVATASLYMVNSAATDGIGYCLLLVGDRNAQVLDTMPPGSAVTQALTVVSTLTAPGTAELSCRNNNPFGGALAIETLNLNAIKVGTLTLQ